MNELNSFIVKFKNLWRSGQDAHLDMGCHAGQAWVGIHVQLGHVAGHQPPNKRNKNTPSRQRRRARRAAARDEQLLHAEEAVGQGDHAAEEAHKIDEVNQKEAVKAPEDVNDEFCSNTEYSEDESREVFSFKSDCAEEYIEECLDDIIRNSNINNAKIILRDELRNGVYLYTLEIKFQKRKLQQESFSWPQMSTSQKNAFQNLKRIS